MSLYFPNHFAYDINLQWYMEGQYKGENSFLFDVIFSHIWIDDDFAFLFSFLFFSELLDNLGFLSYKWMDKLCGVTITPGFWCIKKAVQFLCVVDCFQKHCLIGSFFFFKKANYILYFLLIKKCGTAKRSYTKLVSKLFWNPRLQNEGP